MRPSLLALAIAFAIPAAASAAVTTTTMTSPTAATVDGVGYDAATTSYPLAFSGTSDGTTGDHVTVWCYLMSSSGVVSRNGLGAGSSVAVNADGTFSGTLNAFPAATLPCLLIAVPQGANPSDLTPFHGPQLHVTLDQPDAEPFSPTDALYDYFDAASFAHGFADFHSLGSCGLERAMVFLPQSGGGPSQTTPYTFFCNGYFPLSMQPSPGQYRSAVQIDGRDAYFAATADAIRPSDPWPGLTYSHTYDPATDTFTIVEHDVLSRCPANVTSGPASAGNCSALSSTDVSVKRTMTISDHGLEVEQDDVWSSPTAHSLDLLDEQEFEGNVGKNGYRFPGAASLTPHTSTTAFALPAGDDAESILYRFDTTQGDGPLNSIASTTLYPRPIDAQFYDANDDAYWLHYQLDIPAGGSVTVRKIYAQESTTAALAALTADAEDRLLGPSVSIDAPADGATTGSPTVTVSGTATDNRGVASVTVNGQPATLGSGIYSEDITLAEGQNTITVVASDAAGNTSTATRTVTYQKSAVLPIDAAPGPSPDPTPTPSPAPVAPTIRPDGTVSCPAGGPPCTATGRWKHGRKVIARWRATIAPGQSAKPAPGPTKAGRKLLRKHAVRAVRVLAVRAGTGAPIRSTAKVRLKRRR